MERTKRFCRAKPGQSMVEYAVGSAILLLMALGAMAALDMDTMVGQVLSNHTGGQANGSTLEVTPLGG